MESLGFIFCAVLFAAVAGDNVTTQEKCMYSNFNSFIQFLINDAKILNVRVPIAHTTLDNKIIL